MITHLLNLNLVKELNLDALSSDKKNEIVNRMLEVLESRINLEVLSILSDDEKRELDKILESGGDMIKFLRDKIPNFDVLVAETVANFKKETLDMYKLVAPAA